MSFAVRWLINTILMLPLVTLYLAGMASLFAGPAVGFSSLFIAMLPTMAMSPAAWIEAAFPALLATVVQRAIGKHRARRRAEAGIEVVDPA